MFRVIRVSINNFWLCVESSTIDSNKKKIIWYREWSIFRNSNRVDMKKDESLSSILIPMYFWSKEWNYTKVVLTNKFKHQDANSQ